MINQLYKKNKNYFRTIFQLYLTIPTECIIENKDKIDWVLLSNNSNIDWMSLPEKLLIDYADWSVLSKNSSFKLDHDTLRRFSACINWYSYSGNPSALIDLTTLFEFRDKWNWDQISYSSGLVWDADTIEEFLEEINWASFSATGLFNWDMELIKKYIRRWQWGELARNKNIKWSDTRFWAVYKEIESTSNKGKLDQFFKETCLSSDLTGFKNLALFHPECRQTWSYCRNSQIFWSAAELHKYQDGLDWKGVCANPNITWSNHEIARFRDRIDFNELSNSKSLPWSYSLIQEFRDSWNWLSLSENESIPWSPELITAFSDKWVWGYCDIGSYFSIFHGIPTNQSIIWTRELLKRYQNVINWDCLSIKGNLQESVLLDDSFSCQFNWQLVSGNENINWSTTLLDKLLYKLEVFTVANSTELISGKLGSKLVEKMSKASQINGVLGDYGRKTYGKRWQAEPLINCEEDNVLDIFRPKEIEGIFSRQDGCIHLDIPDFEMNNLLGRMFQEMSLSVDSAALLFFAKHVNLCQILVASGFEFSLTQLKSVADKVDWFYISSNQSIQWSENYIDEFSDRINWENILGNILKLKFCDEFFLYKFSEKIPWHKALEHDNFPWCPRLIEVAIVDGDIDPNEMLKLRGWDFDLVCKYRDKINFSIFSSNWHFDWNDKAVREFERELNWIDLSGNSSLNISKEVLREFSDRLVAKLLIGNDNLPWVQKIEPDGYGNYELEEPYVLWDLDNEDEKDDYSPTSLSVSPTEVRSMFSNNDKLDWIAISKNTNIRDDLDFIAEFKDYLDWPSLCANRTLSSPAEFIDQFEAYIDWVELVENHPVSIEWLERFWHKFEYEDFLPASIHKVFSLSRNPSILINSSRMFQVAFPDIE